ncbi:acyltransferase [Pontibacter sp. 172403-2]|uniref:acyltransferase family protein n=1 Tax=Pontibacter rufus TaxID=2791028 RepID=UPI001A10E953|nr:acyltransferase [Pontibacter sp. 172403-2]MBF9253916.1 acyltransferase [Pontibacter sp. 172403-2]
MPTLPHTKPSTVIAYRPQLDGLRFGAVLTVLFYHFLPTHQMIGRVLDIGVLLVFFFVLSSYLITKILLVGKERGLAAGYSKLKIGAVFLSRRTLRIFPAYYFYIFILLFIPSATYVRENSATFFLYLSNYQIFFDQEWGELTAHLWTLAVEEQFYLFWPWLILLTPNRHLPKMLFLIIACGIISRAVIFGMLDSPATQEVTLLVLTPTCLDGFGFGALLAYQHYYGNSISYLWKKVFFIALPIWIITLFLGNPAISIVVDRVFVSLFAMFILEGANIGYKNMFGRMLEHPVVLYLGKISYGIYLYHIFAVVAFWKVFAKLTAGRHTFIGINVSSIADFLKQPLVSFLIYLGLSIILASASWYLLEKPINKLKRFFVYNSAKKEALKVQEPEPARPALLQPQPDSHLAQPKENVKL